ncbi:MAG: LysR family transcriptional regulator [Desulfobacteraceae bacterium]|nr:LysR family transcriptional regulator [Desulfobacteraceae bacterium]
MEIRNLKTFLTVARLLNFRKSAETLNYAQSTISAQIKILEEELGKPLFQRKGKTIDLTTAGKNLVQYAQKIVAMEKEAVATVAETQSPPGNLSLRIPQTLGTYFLPAILQQFYQTCPNVDFDVASCEYRKLPHDLKSGITDLAFLLADSVDFSELKTEFLGTVNLVMLSSPDHPLARRERVLISDLAGETVFLPKHDCSYKMMFEQWLVQEKIKTASMVEMNSIEAIKQCVAKGLGIAMMPDIAAAGEIARGNLSPLNWEDDAMEAAVLMIWHRGKWISPLLKNFMDTVRTVFRNSPFPMEEVYKKSAPVSGV